MNKPELLQWLQMQNQQWEALLDQIGEQRMDAGGVAGQWSIKDIVAHLAVWQRGLNARLQAALRGEPEPPPLWPAHLQADDEVNAWIYAARHASSVREIVNESREVVQQLLAVVDELPDDARIETIHHEGRDYYFVWLGDQRVQPGEFFDHLHNDQIRSCVAQRERASAPVPGGGSPPTEPRFEQTPGRKGYASTSGQIPADRLHWPARFQTSRDGGTDPAYPRR